MTLRMFNRLWLVLLSVLLIMLRSLTMIEMDWKFVFMPIYIGIPVHEVFRWITWRLWPQYNEFNL